MAVYNSGTLIKLLREEKSISQEQLCDGICTVVTLSRIETGKTEPTRFIFEAIMERLGQPLHYYLSNIASARDIEVFNIRKRLESLIFTKGDDEAAEIIASVENTPEFAEGLNLQFVLRVKAVLILNKINKNDADCEKLELAKTIILNALDITKKDFDTNKIESYLLTDNEIELLNLLANYFLHSKDYSNAVFAYKALLKNIEKRYAFITDRPKAYLMILFNLTNILDKFDKHEEIIELCDRGITEAKKTRAFKWYPYLLSNKMFSFFSLGNIKDAKNLVYDVYFGMRMAGTYKDANLVKNFAQEKLNMKFDFEI